MWRNYGIKFLEVKFGEPEKNMQTPIRSPRNPHEVTETRTRDSAVRGERLATSDIMESSTFAKNNSINRKYMDNLSKIIVNVIYGTYTSQ